MKWTGLVVVLLATAALADVPSDDEALTYAGVFEGAAPGTPVTIALYANATGGNALCGPVSADVRGTRFEARLTAQCVSALRSNAAVFVDVTVGGVSPPRVRLRSVPYSIEAGRAQAASDSVVGSTLRRELDRLLRPRVCGVTASADGAGTGLPATGYSGRTSACRAVAGCSSSAMFCTADQVMRFLMLNPGRSLPFADQAWVAVGLQTNSPTDLITNDCNGFNTSSGNARGMTFNQSGPQPPQPAYVSCGASFPSYCCD